MSENKVKANPKAWLRTIDQMIESGEFIFAEDFLTSVREQVEEHQNITPKQMKAVMNIRRSIQ